MNLDDTGTMLLFTTVHLWIENEDASKSTGTGFIYTVESKKADSSIPFLVTNYHVIKNAARVLVELIEAKNNKPSPHEKLRVEIDGAQFKQFVNPEKDLAVFPIAPILHQVQNTGKQVFYRTIDPDLVPDKEVIDQLGAIEEITFIGYPSGLYDHENSSPLVRRGITSSPIWNDFNGERCFLIDAGVFPGSSGSPVFIYNQGSYANSTGISIGTRLLFIGIISQTMITQNGTKSDVFLGLGKVIKSDELKLFASEVASNIER